MNQIYEAATTGHLEKAQQMITEVLANHPGSAKAHWIQAEILAKEGQKQFCTLGSARGGALEPWSHFVLSARGAGAEDSTWHIGSNARFLTDPQITRQCSVRHTSPRKPNPTREYGRNLSCACGH
jgi:hypothetical protein